MSKNKIKVGIIGCGNISGVYFEHLCNYFDVIELAACADLDITRAQAKADSRNENGQLQFPGVKAVSVDEMLADKSIEIIVNLTIPQAHFEVAMKAINAGKHIYSEKPLTLTRDEGKKLLAAANAKGLRVGNAPDTFLGESHQTARKLIDEGWIGQPVSVTAFMTCHGHESWHPDPNFYYQTGGGPMFDMGPYYLTDMVFLLGGVKSVCGITGKAFAERTITSKGKFGQVMTVNVPTHVAGNMLFHNGVIGTMITSFDIWRSTLPNIEIHGTTGSLSVPDPNGFGGTVKIFRNGMDNWQDVPLTYATNGQRGKGVADMACAILNSRPHRANGEMAYHVLDIMHAFHDSFNERRFVDIESKCSQPAPLPMNVLPGHIGD